MGLRDKVAFLIVVFAVGACSTAKSTQSNTSGSKVIPTSVQEKNKSKRNKLMEAIYMRSKLMPAEHRHGPACEHNQYKID